MCSFLQADVYHTHRTAQDIPLPKLFFKLYDDVLNVIRKNTLLSLLVLL